MTNSSKVRVLITDDSYMMRSLLREFLESDSEIEVIAEAENGKQAIEKVLALKPDVVTMDLIMPIMGGHEAIERIMAVYAVPILVISSLDDAQNAYDAISRGALDAMGKPQLESLDIEKFTSKVKMLSKIKVIKHLSPMATVHHTTSLKAEISAQAAAATNASTSQHNRIEIFAIASSTGGPQALDTILQALPAEFPAPIVIAQHISAGFEEGMAEWLNQNVSMNVKMAQDGELLKAGQVYISPSERHLSIAANRRVVLCDAGDNNIYHPNCDVLLQSVAKSYARHAVGIICTGMGSDGATGMEAIRAAGGITLAQDEASSVIFGMNQVAVARQCIDRILPLSSIAPKMLTLSGYYNKHSADMQVHD